jgi:hypothetical protein
MMHDAVIRDLSAGVDAKVAAAFVGAYEKLVSSFRRGDVDDCLRAAGVFVEHALRAVEFVRTGAPPEIKSVAATVRAIEADASLDDSLRFLVARVAQVAIYEVRSKRGAVHVKGIDPRHIDASLAVHAAGWVIAEFLRLYHSSDEAVVAEAMAALVRGHVPFVETFGAERVVTTKVPCDVELLLLLARAAGEGLNRTALGQASKYASPRVSEAIGRLSGERYVHQTRDGKYHITGPGEPIPGRASGRSGRDGGPSGEAALDDPRESPAEQHVSHQSGGMPSPQALPHDAVRRGGRCRRTGFMSPTITGLPGRVVGRLR